MPDSPDWDEFASWILDRAMEAPAGRVALLRRWQHLRDLAERVLGDVPDEEIRALLGKPREELDPESNDMKAAIAYAVGRGYLEDPNVLQDALSADKISDPLFFLASKSGKAFGETWSPLIAEYWIKRADDEWTKKGARAFYDAGWFPSDLQGRECRIELKASSESPAFRFQQVRHYNLSGEGVDYDVLLCLGVTAGSLEWWAIPVADLDRFADNGKALDDEILITRHHGKRRPIWNEEVGYQDEGWFVANERARGLLEGYCVSSEDLRDRLLSLC